MKKFEIPDETAVEIVNRDSPYYGMPGLLLGTTVHGMEAHYDVQLYYDDEDCECFKDDELLPIQNIITIDNLEYETLAKIFEHNCIYDTDRVIVKQKKFAEDEIEAALKKHSQILAQIHDGSIDFGEEGITLNNRGRVIDLLEDMLGDDYDEINIATAIQETLMQEQWWVEGLRKHCTWNGKGRKPRYFNADAKIDVIYID